jgi:hypothetical protein
MTGFPKLAQRRLSEMAMPDVHPDAVLLTGFIERALTPRLRVQVVEHLSACVECRSVVALAKSQVSTASTPQVVFNWRRPFAWKQLRWAGGLATAAVMAGSLFVVRVEWVARHQTAPSPVVAKSMNSPVIDLGQPIHEAAAVSKSEQTPRLPALASKSRPGVMRSPESLNTRGMIETGADVNQMLDVRNGINSVTGVTKLPPLLPETSPAEAENKQKVLWRIAGPGIVYESFDGGQRWQSVSIRDGLAFRSVASIGSIVWAGGDAGALYRSEDNGLHWTSVPLLGDAQTLMADAVTHIEFSDAKRGKVTTAQGKTWVTADGGQTWQQQ